MILSVIVQQHLSFDLHVTELLEQCSQHVYLLCLLCSHGLSTDQLNVVFTGLIVFCLLYTLPTCGMFASAADTGRIDALLKRAYKRSFSKDIVTLNEL